MINKEKYGVKHPKEEIVVYWIERLYRWPGSQSIANEYTVQYGLLREICPDVIVVERLDIDWRREIDGTPIEDFVTPSEWRKLPKGWSWNTRLFTIANGLIPEQLNEYIVTRPEDVLRAYHDGVLKRVADIDYSKFSTEITKQGWRIVRDIYQTEYHPMSATLSWHEAYDNGKDAYAEANRLNKELAQTADMTDHEFNVFDMDNMLNSVPWHAPEIREQYREFLLSLSDFDDLEFRYSTTEGIQWKHWKKRKWNSIQLDAK